MRSILGDLSPTQVYERAKSRTSTRQGRACKDLGAAAYRIEFGGMPECSVPGCSEVFSTARALNVHQASRHKALDVIIDYQVQDYLDESREEDVDMHDDFQDYGGGEVAVAETPIERWESDEEEEEIMVGKDKTSSKKSSRRSKLHSTRLKRLTDSINNRLRIRCTLKSRSCRCE